MSSLKKIDFWGDYMELLSKKVLNKKILNKYEKTKT